MKRLLILGGGFLQTYVIQKARSLNYYVLCLDANPKAIGFQYANEHAVINIIDTKACLEYARTHNIDGVLTAATDYGVLSMSCIATELNLPGINYSSAQIIKNKAAVRKCLYDAHADDTGYAYEISSIKDAENISSHITYPVMVKPADGSGSRGASKVDSSNDFIEACAYAMDGSITRRAIAEPFIEGAEYGVESFIDNGVIHILAVMQKEMTAPPYYAELGHRIPSGLPLDLENKIKDCVRKAIIALDINHGSVNMDLILSKEGSVHIVDIGARMGGNLIGSHIIQYGTGIDYIANMIKAAVRDQTEWQSQWQPYAVATKLLALKPGKIKALPDFEAIKIKYDVEIEHHLNIGDTITPYRTNLDGCGYVIAHGNDINDIIYTTNEVKDLIDKSIIRN